jgi:hypothetical protein
MRAPRPDRALISFRPLAGFLLAAALLGCEASGTPSAPPISLAMFSLTEMAPRTGCELVRLDYGSLTFRIKPDAPVEAITANGHMVCASAGGVFVFDGDASDLSS